MLHIHRAERADGLVLALRAILADPPEDPFAAEVVSVPTRGMERWLTQRLSDGLGICANVGFPPPRVLIGDAIAAVSGVDPETDPWLPERLVWPLLDVVTGALEEPWAGDLATHLGGADDPVRRARRFATVRHLAGLFDRYGTYRPELLLGWAEGEADDDWQAELWRRLRARIGVPSPAERLADGCARLRAEPGLVALPPRVGLFGLTRLPAADLEVLRALGAGRDVHLFVLHPSPALWEALAGGEPIRRRAEDRTAALARNRLLGSWGNDARELQLVLAGPGTVDHHHPVAHAEGTLLARIQADVRADRAPAGDLVLDPGDRSVQVHACHGRARQVEALRDAILHRLDGGPDAGAARRDRHVPRHRDVRAADPRDVRGGRGERGRGRRAAGRAAAAGPPRPARRPLAAADQPGARRRRRPARPRRRAADRLAGARPRRPRAGPPPLPARRRRRRPARGLDRRERDPLGAGRGAPCAVQARRRPGRHVAARARPAPARRDDDRGRRADRRRRAAARRRRQRCDRPRRPLRRARRPARDRPRGAPGTAADRGLGRGAGGRRRRAVRHRPARRVAARAAPAAARRDGRGGGRAGRADRPGRGPRAVRRAAAGTPDARELPHRPPDDLHARADAVGPAPRRLPARPRRRRLPAPRPARRRRPPARATRTSASATPAARTASSCSTR